MELYWHALARDVPFAEYDSSPLIARAAEDLSRLSAFRGPKERGRVNARTIFRGNTPGDLAGPYISQLLWKDVPFTPIRVEQKLRIAVPGVEYMTGFDNWLACQNGALTEVNRFDPRPHYIRTGRDLGEYVHRDFTYQAFLGACLILFKMGALPDGANPYRYSRTQSGLHHFRLAFPLLHARRGHPGGAHGVLVSEVDGPPPPAARGIRRPVGGPPPGRRPLSPARRSPGLRRPGGDPRQARLRPAADGLSGQGCPAHPSYPAGHAVIGGACVTVLKAFFDESYVVPEPVVPAPDGLSLVRYQGPPLTLGGELDKLAANIALGRDFAGIHWRSDSSQGLALGEELAIEVLQEMKLTGNELFQGFSFQRFDGVRVTI